ncbi:neuron navigator 3-like isoform X3 [Macrobrachium nipponense]|uniref:neuron navigator 3-like isoform X3 n=1 Tax=Macrobrachium nipponense TaxID=159736 RepID=UPI0030C7C4F0
MAPMFCTKLFNWNKSGKGKKDGGPRPALDTVYPEPQDEGEACPYWTHVQCNPPPPPQTHNTNSRPHTPTHGQTRIQSPPPLPPHHPGSPVHHQPTPRSPVSHRRAAHARNHQVRCGHDHPYQYNTTYNSPYHSPHQSPGPNSPVGQNSPVHFMPIHHSPATHSPVHHSPVRCSPVHYGSGYNSPAHHSPVHHSPVHHSPVHHSPVHHSPVHQSPGHQSPWHSPLHHRGYVLESNYSQPLPPPPPQRPPPPLPGQEGSQLKSGASASSSRSTSPANGTGIPQPRSHGGRASLNEKHAKTSGTSSLARSSLRGPGNQGSQHAGSNHSIASPYHTPTAAAPAKHKDSMLEKFKLFNHKEKEGRNKTTSSSGVSKRTSSSSGFSSAKSERSDSSTSLCSDAKPPPLPPHQSLPVSTSSSSSEPTSHADQHPSQPAAPAQSKPQGLRGIRSKFSKSGGKEGKESPKSSRKEKEREDRESSRASPRGGHKAHRDPRAERGENRERGGSGGGGGIGGGGGGREERSSGNKKSEKLTLELDGGNRSRQELAPPIHQEESKEARVASAPSVPGPDYGDSQIPPALPPKENAHKNHHPQLQLQQQQQLQQHAQIPPSDHQSLNNNNNMQMNNEHVTATTPGSPLPPGAPGTGIPKPTAHVKGQTKVMPPERTAASIPNSPSPNVNSPSQTKDYNNKMVRHGSSGTQQKVVMTGASGTPRAAVTPVGSDGHPAQDSGRDPKGSLPRQKQLGRREDSATGITVALVSPMPNTREKELVTPSESGSNISESSQSNSGHSNSNSSGNSSVIYKPTSSEDDSVSDFKAQIRKVDEKHDGEEGDEVILNIKPMQPLVRASQYGYIRGLGLHQARTVPPSVHVSRLALQDSANTVPQKGMRLGPHLKRPPGTNQIIDADYSDLESVELTNGYMSDGDVLRNVGYKSGNSSDLDGYLSEGGASLYAHRLNQRFKEGMRQVHESMNKVQHFIHDDSSGIENELELSSLSPSTTSSEHRHYDEDDYLDDDYKTTQKGDEDEDEGDDDEEGDEEDIFNCDESKLAVARPVEEEGGRDEATRGFDDSSSLSSGVSDTLNEMSAEEVLSSSLSSDHPAYAKGRSMKELGLKLPVGLSGSSPRKMAMGVDPSGMYKVVSSRAHVKKTESAQQTDNSAFKQISNTQWKKYVENGKGSLERSAKELQKGVDASGSSSRKMDHKKSNLGSPQTGMPSSPGMNSNPVSNSSGGSRKVEKKGTSSEKRREGERSSKDRGMSAMSPQLNGDSKKIQNPKTAPSNFGYNGKRTTSTGSMSSTGSSKGSKSVKEVDSGSASRHDGSSHSLERPRTKLKVSGGTQTTSDLHYMSSGVHSDSEYSSGSLGRKYQLKSYSLNGPVAAQLSQSVRERIMQSPYSKVHVGDYGQYASPYYRERNPRMKPTDGSLSDSPYSNYAELQYGGSPYSSPYSWVSRSNYAGSVASAPTRPLGGSLTEAESMESISSSASSIAAQIQHARATSLTQARLMMHQREMSSSPSPRLARSNSVRSTKSEKLYSSNVSGRETYHASQPTSPTPPGSARMPISPLNTVRGSPYYSTVIPRTSKDDDCHGSSLSLVSSSSSLYSSQEEKQAAEIRKLRKELAEAQDKVGTLTNQLTTNNSVFNFMNTAHVVAAFEQSLTNMTNRLQQLTATSEQKDSEVMELRKTIEALRQQSVDAGLTVACLQSTFPAQHHHSTPSPTRHHNHHPSHPPNIASCSVLNVTTSSRSSSPEKSGHHDLARRHTFTGNCKDLVVCEFNDSGGKLVRGTSVESVSSLSSACSATSHTSNHDKSDSSKSSKKKGWLRSSFSKAFSRGHKKNKHGTGGSVSDVESWERGECSAPASPLMQRASGGQSDAESHSTTGTSMEAPTKNEDVEVLMCQLREKDMALTDIRLEALSSAHQLESLKETISKMRDEMVCLKQDNERLHRMVSSKSLNSSQSSLPVSDSVEQRLSLGDELTMPDSTDVILIDPSDKDGKRVSITVMMGCHGDYEKYLNPVDGVTVSECVIGAISVSGKTKWDMLDSLVKRIFKEYILRVDPVSNLGLSAESILSYHIGEITRGRDPDSPELLPCGYLVGEVMNVKIILKGATINHVDALAFETMIPKSIIHRYVSLLTEHRRIILCGPSGTGKTYLAQKMAEYLVTRMGKDPSPGHIATFNVDHKNGKDLGAYLSHISDQCENNTADLPLVIILDNLHHAGALTDVFNGFLSAKYTQCPYIIGTMNQTTSCSTTNLQLHHNFSRWVLMANHMEPVKGLVGRVARRKLTQVEVEAGSRLPKLQQVLDWLPRCWSHINKFLETHSSSDVTIGPRLFLSCPGSLEGSQVWFTDLWNYSLVPYLVEAVREGLQLYGKRATWEDPSTWITETYPWPPGNHPGPQALLSLRPEDVGYDALAPTVTTNTQDKFKSDNQGENDPLLSMLMRLQEAANYSSPQQDSDNTSLDNMENALESTI